MTTREYVLLGNSGLRVSRLGLGALTFGTEWGWGADKPASQAMFDTYLAAGGNLVDTADLYTGGTSERWIGEFIRASGQRDRLVISTKFGYSRRPDDPNAGGNGRKNMLRAVEASLERLGTDYVDLYFIHNWDMLTPVDEVLRGFDDLVRSGKVRYLGLSDVPAWYASRAQAIAECRGLERICALQLEYSLIERTIENEFVELCARHGMSLMAWSPLASGLLTGKYGGSAAGGPGAAGSGRLRAMAGAENPYFARFSNRNLAIAEELVNVARDLGLSPAQVAINWVANRRGVAAVLVGATRPEQFQDNLRALDFSIPPELAERLDAVSAVPPGSPYTFFTPGVQANMVGSGTVSEKPAGYARPTSVRAGTRDAASVADQRKGPS